MATESLRADHVSGNLRAVTARLTTVSNGDTWAPGLGTVIWAGLTDQGKTASRDVGATWSGATVTLAVEGGTVTMDVIAFGY